MGQNQETNLGRGEINRMNDDRLAKIAKDEKSNNPRPPGRSPKHWCESWTSRSQENRHTE